MTTNTIGATGNTALDALSNVGKSTAKGSSTLDQSAFLKLMTTQLKTQDPFDPVDNQQMIAQMAQFSSVAGISEMNASLKGIADDVKASRIGDASNWIGRSALVSSAIATPLANGSYAGQVTLPEDATSVSISLVDANGSTVHSENVGATKAGGVDFIWDGKDARGDPAADGPLNVIVAASTGKGFMKAATATWTRISGVQSPAGGANAKLVTGLGLVSPADAQKLS